MPTLYVLSGPEIGRQFVLADGAVLGRADDCDAVLRHLSVSRRHARLERKRAGWRIRDLGSRNGLFENGRRVKHLFLEDGTEFLLGELELRVRFAKEDGGPPPDARSSAAGGSEESDTLDGLAETTVRPAPAAEPEPLEEDIEFADETPVAPPAVEPAAQADPIDDDEILLEEPDEIDLEDPGEIDFGAPSAPPPAAAPVRPAPTAPRAPSRPTAAQRAGIPTKTPTAAQDPARKALQYSRIESNGGFLSADLGQYPLWVRLVALVLALVLFAGLFVLAFRTASS